MSNWDHRLPQVLANLGLERYFDAVVHSSACGCEKPHPRIFQSCLEALAVPPARALHVGDGAIEDVEGALALGMRAIRIDRQQPRGHLGALITPFLGSPTVRALTANLRWALPSSLDANRHGR